MKKKLKDDKDLSMTMGIEGTERMIVSQILDNIGAIKGDITMINKPELPIIICESLQ